MSTTVSVGGFEVTSNTNDTAAMVESLTPSAPEDQKPRVLVDQGKPVKDSDKDEISEAASKLGKKGGAAKAARAIRPIKDAPKETKVEGEHPERNAEGVAAGGSGEDNGDLAEDGDGAQELPDEAKEAKSRAAARVTQATREAAEAKREAAELKVRLERLERERSAPEQRTAKPAEQPAAQTKPQSGDYAEYDDYLDARDQHNRDQWTREMSQRQHAHSVAAKEAAELDGMFGGWKKMLAETTAADPQFTEAVKPAMDLVGYPTRILKMAVEDGSLPRDTRPNGHNWIADELMSAPERAAVLLPHLAENLPELKRIAALSSPREVTRELAILGARIDATAGNPSIASHPAPKPESSKANPPVRPVTGAPSVAQGPQYREGMTLDDYARGWKPPKQ